MSVKTVEIACSVQWETDKAMLINDGDTAVWVPKSMISDSTETNGVIESIFIPQWFAEDKELV